MTNQIINSKKPAELQFKILSKSETSATTQQVFEQILQAYKFVPNITGIMANHPSLLNTYWFGNGYLETDKKLSDIEQQVVFLTASLINKCHYCVAAHSTIAEMYKMPLEIINALREGQSIADPKLEALRRYTEVTVVKRGRVSEEDINLFLSAEYGKEHMLEVIVIVSLKVLTNYLNYLAKTPLDKEFKNMEWIAF